jgi:hypothetical protein
MRLRGHSLEKSPRLRLPPSSIIIGVRRPGSVRLCEYSEGPEKMTGGDLLRDLRDPSMTGERDRDLRVR